MPEREVLNLISPNISHHVLHLLREAQLGISTSTVRITDLNTSCPTVTCQDGGICDRFKVGIQYAGQTLTWEVLFDCNYPEDPPDFIFGSEDADFFPDIDKLPSLVAWDYRDPSCLLHVIEQLLDQYRQHQEKVISQLPRLDFEYTQLTKNTDTESDDVEIHIARSENRVGPINFLIKLHVDFSRIPAYIVRLDPGEDIAILLVTFNNADGSRITPQLYLSPRVERMSNSLDPDETQTSRSKLFTQIITVASRVLNVNNNAGRALGGPTNLRIPGFPLETSLIEYVPEVTLLLKNKVDQIVQCYEKRKEYIAAFLSLYGRSYRDVQHFHGGGRPQCLYEQLQRMQSLGRTTDLPQACWKAFPHAKELSSAAEARTRAIAAVGGQRVQIDQQVERLYPLRNIFVRLRPLSVLEYDTEGFTEISFLFEWNDFFFVIMIELHPFFPKEQPTLTFQSIYHELKGKPYTEIFQDYPYSPRWSGLQMAERARAFILDNIGNFQKASVVTCTT